MRSDIDTRFRHAVGFAMRLIVVILNKLTPRPLKFKYKVVLHEKNLSNLKVDPLRVLKE